MILAKTTFFDPKLKLEGTFQIPFWATYSGRMLKKMPPIDPELIFAQDLCLRFFFEAPRSVEIELSEAIPYSHSRVLAL